MRRRRACRPPFPFGGLTLFTPRHRATFPTSARFGRFGRFARFAKVSTVAAFAGFILFPLLACRALNSSPADSTPTPALAISAPPRLMPAARGLAGLPAAHFASEVRLLGLGNPGPPIRVWLAPEQSPQARAVPSWVAGYASGAAGGWVVLLPARSPTYPSSSLADVLRHEVAHVLVYRAAGGRPLPRWFDEGVAMIAAGDWGLNDRTKLALALLSSPRAADTLRLAGLDRRFAGHPGEVETAYAVAGGFVHHLLAQHGPEAVARVLDEVSRGLPFEPAFEKALGYPLAQVEAAFWAEQSRQRWLPLLTSPAVLWTAVALLALLAILLRRRRDAARRARWAAEEAAADDAHWK
jgi:hypothetical protein